jgi:hypothetical protein
MSGYSKRSAESAVSAGKGHVHGSMENKSVSSVGCFQTLLCPCALQPETLALVTQLAALPANCTLQKHFNKKLKILIFDRSEQTKKNIFLLSWTFRENFWYLYVLHSYFDQ